MDSKKIQTENTYSTDSKTSNAPVQVTGATDLNTPKQPKMAKSKREANLKDYLVSYGIIREDSLLTNPLREFSLMLRRWTFT